MAQPPKYVPNYVFTDWQSAHPADPLPANQVDSELGSIQDTTDAIVDNLALIQRDDGELANGIVSPDSLSSEVSLMISTWVPRGAWLTATAYSALDVVREAQVNYVCLVAHTAGVFATDLAAGKWQSLSSVVASSISNAHLAQMPANTFKLNNTGGAANPIDGTAAQAMAMLPDFVVDSGSGGVAGRVPAPAAGYAAANRALFADGWQVVFTDVAGALAGTATDLAVTPEGLKAYIDQLVAPLLGVRRNLLVNSGFQVDQVGFSGAAVSDGSYSLDQWYVLTQTAAVNVSQQTLQENGSPYNIRLEQNQVSAQRMGVAQVIEARDSRAFRGSSVVLSARIRCSAAQAIRYAILSWDGTADSPTKDVVNAWANTNYTAGDFFLGSNLSVVAVGSITPSAAAWTDITAITGAVGASANNLYVFFWTEDTAAQNVTLDVARVQLEPGATATVYQRPSIALDLPACQRFFERIKTASSRSLGSGFVDTSGTSARVHVPCATKRSVPTVTMNGNLALGVVGSDPSIAAASVAFSQASETGFRVDLTTTSLTAGHGCNLYLPTSSDYIDVNARL